MMLKLMKAIKIWTSSLGPCFFSTQSMLTMLEYMAISYGSEARVCLSKMLSLDAKLVLIVILDFVEELWQHRLSYHQVYKQDKKESSMMLIPLLSMHMIEIRFPWPSLHVVMMDHTCFETTYYYNLSCAIKKASIDRFRHCKHIYIHVHSLIFFSSEGNVSSGKSCVAVELPSSIGMHFELSALLGFRHSLIFLLFLVLRVK